MKILKKQNKQLMKIMAKSKKSSKKEKKNLHKIVSRTRNIALDSSDSDSSSDSSSDSDSDWNVPRSPRSINIMDKVIDDNQNTKLKNPNHINEIRFSSSNDIDTTIPLRNKELPIPVTTVDILKGKKAREIHVAGLSCLWDGGASDSMVKKSYVRKFRDKFKHNLQVYDTAAGEYTSEYEVKINFTMPEFSGSKIIKHKFQVDNEDVNANIGYDMIIGRDLQAKLGCITNFKRNVLTWEDISVPMRSAYTDTDKPRFSRAEIHEIIKQTAEPLATQEATERAIKILDSNYEAADLDEIARNAEQLDDEQKAKLLVLLKCLVFSV